MKRFALAVCLIAVGCKGGAQQLPPTTHTLTLTVTSTVPSGSTWVASKETITGTVCDPPTSTNYKQINSTPQASAVFVDATSAGTRVCEFMQYIDAAKATSPASNVIGPLDIPANPTAPIVNGTQAFADPQFIFDTKTGKIMDANGKVLNIVSGGSVPLTLVASVK